MKVLVIGSGAREHAFAWKLAQSVLVDEVVCAPGNAGTAVEPKCRNIDIAAMDIPNLVLWAIENKPDLTVVGPEGPLCAGIVDQWPDYRLIVGPKRYPARLEGSKIFAREMMGMHNIPQPEWKAFDSVTAAEEWLMLQPKDKPWVVKANGLAAGKGVLICKNRTEAIEAVAKVVDEFGKDFLIEKFLTGREVSLFLFCGKNGQIRPLETAQDYKRALDGDEGGNTGGMGAYSPANHLSAEIIEEIIEAHRPLIADIGFVGSLYIGLMLTDEGWKVLEYNVRMGDPETQAVLPRMKTDIVPIFVAMANGDEYNGEIEWYEQACVTVVMAAKGYPGTPKIGDDIEGLPLIEAITRINADAKPIDGKVFYAGAKFSDDGDEILTNGGRVLSVSAIGKDHKRAAQRAYQMVEQISWPGEHHRTDIASDVK
ncbi:MAG: phosphoribosylamine--glycine ligase [bacterium]